MRFTVPVKGLNLRETSAGEGNHSVRRAEINADGVHESFRK
jgi:hypothetical protein